LLFLSFPSSAATSAEAPSFATPGSFHIKTHLIKFPKHSHKIVIHISFIKCTIFKRLLILEVIEPSFFLISQDLISLVDLLYAFFAFRIASIPVGMILHCKFTIDFLDLLCRRIALKPECIVLIHSHFSLFLLLVIRVCMCLHQSREESRSVLHDHSTSCPDHVPVLQP